MNEGVIDAMTVDVEDWHNATVLQVSDYIMPPTDSVKRNTERMLVLFGEYGIKATWFFLGEVAEAFPRLVQMVVESGHEVGVHGYHHHQIQKLSREEYRNSILRAKDAVEQAAGTGVIGYRAVDFGINRKTWYAFDVLSEAGFKYDSSIFPFGGPRYGMSDAPPGPHWIKADNGGYIYEIPMSVVTLLGIRLPGGGGGYLRHFPLFLTRMFMKQLHREGRSVVFYLHPCEIEFPSQLQPIPDQLTSKQVALIQKCYAIQIQNRRHTEPKLSKLFTSFKFGTIRAVFGIDEITEPIERKVRRN
jgi:polysaccharide deacetylase family protein (PEP-CTERM system associated)